MLLRELACENLGLDGSVAKLDVVECLEGNELASKLMLSVIEPSFRNLVHLTPFLQQIMNLLNADISGLGVLFGLLDNYRCIHEITSKKVFWEIILDFCYNG